MLVSICNSRFVGEYFARILIIEHCFCVVSFAFIFFVFVVSLRLLVFDVFIFLLFSYFDFIML